MNSAVPRTLPADVCGAAEEAGDAEIGELHLPVGRQEQIPRLDVAVDHAAVVGVAQGPGDINADPRHVPPGEGPPAVQLLFQAAAGDQFHGVEEVLVLVAEAEQPDDVRMVELSQGFDFRLEAMAEIGVVGHRGGEQLDGRRLRRSRRGPPHRPCPCRRGRVFAGFDRGQAAR